jgi:cell division protein ZapB
LQPILITMNTSTKSAEFTQQFERELHYLEDKLNDLLTVCDKLREENDSLKKRQDSLVNERAGLLQKNEQVRNRVEAMINRLKGMEQNL